MHCILSLMYFRFVAYEYVSLLLFIIITIFFICYLLFFHILIFFSTNLVKFNHHSLSSHVFLQHMSFSCIICTIFDILLQLSPYLFCAGRVPIPATSGFQQTF